MAEVRALDAFVPSLKRMILLALLSSTLVEVGNGQCSDALGCSVGEVCCWGNYCVKGSSCAGQFCEYYTDCSSSTLICCNSVCVKRSSCLGQDCLGNDDCSKGEKCCKKKCVRGDHCPKSKCPFASCGFLLLLVCHYHSSQFFVFVTLIVKIREEPITKEMRHPPTAAPWCTYGYFILKGGHLCLTILKQAKEVIRLLTTLQNREHQEGCILLKPSMALYKNTSVTDRLVAHVTHSSQQRLRDKLTF